MNKQLVSTGLGIFGVASLVGLAVDYSGFFVNLIGFNLAKAEVFSALEKHTILAKGLQQGLF
jgi:hypothetical protein